MRRLIAILLGAGSVGLTSLMVFLPTAVFAKDVKVELKDSVFEPASITIQAGDTITFTNTGQLPHTATAKDKSWDTGNLNTGQSKTITFAKAGTIDYICIYHESQGMVGKITVEGTAAAATPTSAPTPAGGPSPSPVPEGSPATDPSPEGSPEVAEAQPTDPNATVPIGLKLFPFLAIGLVALFAVVAGAGYLRSILSTTEGR